MKQQLIIGGILLLVVGGLGFGVFKSLAGKNEQEIIKKYGRYFNSGYWKSEFKRMYYKEYSEYLKKGFTESQIFAYMLPQYFDRVKYENIMQVIKDSKGVFSDDESKAILAIGQLDNLMEVSYLATVFANSGDSGYADEVGSFFSNPLSYVATAVSGEGKLTEADNNLLYFLLTYFNAKDRKLLHKVLAKMKKRGVKKNINAPQK